MLLGCVVSLTLAVMFLASTALGASRYTREAEPGISERTQPFCPRACFNDYVPVCGFNPCRKGDTLRTFDSKCRQEATVCDGKGQYFYFVYNGPCDSRK